jgi:transmembrane sensor
MNSENNSASTKKQSEVITPAEIITDNIPNEVECTAVEWLLEWQMADDSDLIWQQVIQWRQASNLHELAWQKIETVNGQIALLAQSANNNIAQQVIVSPHTSRRQALKVLSVLFVVTGSSWLTMRQQPWQRWSADHYTDVGQQLKLQLEDGSELYLNSSSVIDIKFSVTERRIVLTKGEIYVNTGKDSAYQSQFNHVRPLVIELAQGQVRPIGTRFSVRQFNSSFGNAFSNVSVYQGKVQLQGNNLSQAVVVNAGQQRTLTDNFYGTSQPVSEAQAAWIQGMIVASDMRLEDFLTELNRHRSGVIQCAPAVANLKVSGTYPLNQADSVLQSLVAALPIKIRSFSRYWLRVLPVTT